MAKNNSAKNTAAQSSNSVRHSTVESLEPRILFNVDPLWVGGVYVEEDNGGDAHGDSFYVTFRGGAAGTQLTKLVIDTDQGAPGFSSGDNLFDTADGGLGADHGQHGLCRRAGRGSGHLRTRRTGQTEAERGLQLLGAGAPGSSVGWHGVMSFRIENASHVGLPRALPTATTARERPMRRGTRWVR